MLLSLKGNYPLAILALADGTIYIGDSIGATGECVGEVVFNTSMTGYQEILTDPSYCQQIVTLTYPHIGNYGVNPQDTESCKVQASGLVIRDLPAVASNFRQTETLESYLQAAHTVAIANIDTRKLTRQIRSQGAQNLARPCPMRASHTRWHSRVRRRPWLVWTWPVWSQSMRLTSGRRPSGR